MPLLFTTMVALVFILPLAFIAVPLGREGQDVVKWVNQARHSGVPVPPFLPNLPFASHLVPLWQKNLGDPQAASELLGRVFSGKAVSMGRNVGSQVFHRLVLFGFTLLTLYFLFRDGEHLNQRLLTASRRLFGPPGETVGRQIVASVHGTVDGLVLVGLGEGVIAGIAYGFAGVPHPTIFGLITGILAMIPFGAAVAFWLAGALLLVLGKTTAAIAVVVIGLTVSFLADHFIRPTLIGSATRLPFLWVLFGILGGISAWGLLGLFVGPAIMAALILLWRQWVGDEKGVLSP
jgi:predicted PurR-regulated permease PerM